MNPFTHLADFIFGTSAEDLSIPRMKKKTRAPGLRERSGRPVYIIACLFIIISISRLTTSSPLKYASRIIKLRRLLIGHPRLFLLTLFHFRYLRPNSLSSGLVHMVKKSYSFL